MNTQYLIIGCGPTGLGAAYKLRELGVSDFVLLEQADYPGGLATSFQDREGFWWDIGGHVQFSHYEYFDKAMLDALPAEQWLEHQRESWVWIKERFVPYPFQNNIRYLPKESVMECLRGLLKAWREASTERPANFREWIVRVFGEGIAREFMLPYNFKVWAYPPEEMAYQWIGERVAVVEIERILENLVFEKMDASWGPNNTFKFPVHGGTGAIWRSIARIIGQDKIVLGAKVVEVDPFQKTVTTEDGRVIHYQSLLSTMPVDALTSMTKGLSPRVVSAAQKLKHSTSHIVGVGIQGEPPRSIGTKCWMYFPEDNCPFYRVTVFSNYSPNNVPDSSRYYSLMTETSESRLKPVNTEKLVGDTVDGLKATKLIGPDDQVVSTWYHRAAYGYPTPSIARDAILNLVIPSLDALDVYSRGRFGGWKYEVSNQDHTFMQGVEWAELMINSIPERTYTVLRAPVTRVRQGRHAKVRASGSRSGVKSASQLRGNGSDDSSSLDLPRTSA